MCRLTKHAQERIGERCGLPKKATQRMADKAFEHGACRREFSGAFRRYLDDQYYATLNANNMRVHAEHIWFFANTTLITVWRVPHEFIGAANRARHKEAA